MVEYKIDWLGRFYSLFLFIVILATFVFVLGMCFSVFMDSQMSLVAKSIAVIFGIVVTIGSALFLKLVYTVLWKSRIKTLA